MTEIFAWNKLRFHSVTLATYPMKHFFRFAVLAALTLILCAAFSMQAHAQQPDNALRKQADAAFAEKSYARAIELYRQVKAVGPSLDEAIVNYNISVSLFKMEKWDEAIKSANFTLQNSDWPARVLYLLGQIYVKVPHRGYEINGQIYRGDEYPQVEGAEKLELKYLGEEDQKKALDYLESAKVAAQKERADAKNNRYFAPIYPITAREEIDLNFDLAAFLPQVGFNDYIAQLDKGEVAISAVDPRQKYSKSWILPEKVLTLYAEIRLLDESKPKADAARSLYAEGLFARAYRQRMDNWARKYDDESKKQIVRSYPFDNLSGVNSWRQLVRDTPASPLAPQTLILIAQAQQNDGDLIAATATLRELVVKYPKTKWVADARAGLAQIEKREVSFNLLQQTRPGVQPKINVQARNVKTVEFAAYKVKLEDYLARADNLKNAETQFTEFSENFGQIAAATRKFGKPLATWKLETGTKSDYQPTRGETQIPVDKIGAYAVVAQAGGVRFAQIVIITDLALLKKVDKDGSFVFVADAKSGAEIRGVNVVLKETWDYDPRKSEFVKGQSNDGGFFDKKRGANASNSNRAVEAFAWSGDRYALTGAQNLYLGYYGDDENQRALGTTDRPVYRPGQQVNFRQILTTRKGGDWSPLVGATIRVTASNPKGEQIFKQDFTSSEFGSVNGDFTLPAETPLGVYQISAALVKADKNEDGLGGTQFRVEEYKRPEFEVTVTAPTEAKRPGETVAARINAKYYFGSPVPNAKVKYTVRKASWWANYHFPSPYDWLYASWGVGDYDTGRRNIGGEGSGAIVKEGEVTTDEQGFAELSFKTDELEPIDDNNWWARTSNPLYTIEAEVTDASRRTIEAQGEVKVARQQYFAFLDADRGYLNQGDRVPIELRTQDANAVPVAASGQMTVYRLLPGDKEEKIFEEAISTNKEGYAKWTWEAKESGQFRVEYRATDEWGQEVKASQQIWVVGDKIGAVRLRGVTILLDKESYAEGETLKARLVADKPGATVLLTQEVGSEILRRDVVKIDGQSREVSIPIDKARVPNFFLSAALVQDYDVYQAQTEVFVPPVRQLLNIAVKGDKAVYQPGETGTFEVTALDYAGKPARAEVSLALTDASLFYIQKSFTSDARQFYYADRRSDEVGLDSSRSGNPQARREDDNKTPNYETHGLELPDDLGQLQLTPGAFGYYGYVGGFGGGGMSFSRGRADTAFASLSAGIAPAAPMMAGAAAAPRKAASMENKSMSESETNRASAPPVEVRSNFAETAYWSPAIVTENGKATVKVTFPDSLTQWHASALGLTKTVQVGAAESDVATKKDLLVRLQAPRFFVERDQVTISANVHNYTGETQTVKVQISLDEHLFAQDDKGNLKPPVSDAANPSFYRNSKDVREIVIAPGEERRIDQIAGVIRPGEATIQVTARTATASDGVKLSFPVLVHGVQRFDGKSGILDRTGRDMLLKTALPQGKTVVTFNFPKERQLGASRLNVQLNPSLAGQMLEALPYLADYPYGCVEQTMSRFLPTVIVQKTLKQSGVDLETLRRRALAYDAQAKDEPVGERIKNSGYSYPQGQPNARDLAEMSSQMFRRGRSNNPIYDAKTVDKMTREGLQRLYTMQRGDGGWGWWPGSSSSDPYMSAYVVYGLWQAQKADVKVRDDVLRRGMDYLQAQMKDEDNLQLLTYMAYAISQGSPTQGRRTHMAWIQIAKGRLFEQRERLVPLSKAYLAMTLDNAGDQTKANVVVRNLENTVVIDAANGTARYQTARQYWYWWNNDVETVALALRAFDQIEPGNKLAPMLMKWLTLQARGNHYRSTKETAEVVYTLADYVVKNRELDVDYVVKVNLNGKLARTYRVTKENALWFDNRFITGDVFLNNGENTLTIEKSGVGKLYWNAYSEYFSLEEPIKSSGNELEVARRFFKLTRKTADAEKASEPAATAGVAARRIAPFPRPLETQQEYTRTPIKDEATVQSGDLIEVELVVNARNDYEYLIFEDMKAAGFEPVDLRSGASYGDGLSSNVELRDEKVAFFVDRLPQGRRVLRYRVRAQVPGQFHALPTNGYAMYAPEVRAISDETRVGVQD